MTPRERYLLKSIEKATRQPLTPMQLPTAEDINSTRLSRFDDAITAALSSDQHRVLPRRCRPLRPRARRARVDVAAALAVVLQGDAPLLLEPEPERPVRTERKPRTDSQPRDRGQGPTRAKGRSDSPMSTYRIEVGRRQKVEPRQIVGALANEGGLRSSDFGHIDIRPDHSLVELPSDLSPDVWKRLRKTRISGKLIDLKAEGKSEAKSHGKPRKPRKGKQA